VCLAPSEERKSASSIQHAAILADDALTNSSIPLEGLPQVVVEMKEHLRAGLNPVTLRMYSHWPASR
jgi:hypothetical protein